MRDLLPGRNATALTLPAAASPPPRAEQNGTSAPREWPAITTHNHDNHGIRTEDWRYIRYADGSEELYNMKSDPNEWNNLLAPAPGKENPVTRAKANELALLSELR